MCSSHLSKPRQETNDAHPVYFPIEPIIPATAIQRYHAFPIATGRRSDVWQCSMSTRSGTRCVAIKSIRISNDNERSLVQHWTRMISREACVWIRLSHDNILPLEGITEEFGPLPALVAPWMENGSLDDYVKRKVDLPRDKKLRMLREVATGLHYLHDAGIVHGDLTPSSILISGDEKLHIGGPGVSATLAEFDCPRFTSRHPRNVRWIAPELFGLEYGAVKPTKAADIYSYGCIMMLLLYGHQPYHQLTTAFHIIAARVSGREPFRQITGLSEDLEQFAQQCLSTSSEQRPSISVVAEFVASRTHASERTKEFLSDLPVNEISKSTLSRCNNDSDRGSLNGSLKCNWLRESSVVVGRS
ncbi:kinase-like domain-containing protein [Suillus subluteus]|nr:kinase-like domain-containing protein [Suillus subluteus]